MSNGKSAPFLAFSLAQQINIFGIREFGIFRTTELHHFQTNPDRKQSLRTNSRTRTFRDSFGIRSGFPNSKSSESLCTTHTGPASKLAPLRTSSSLLCTAHRYSTRPVLNVVIQFLAKKPVIHPPVRFSYLPTIKTYCNCLP